MSFLLIQLIKAKFKKNLLISEMTSSATVESKQNFKMKTVLEEDYKDKLSDICQQRFLKIQKLNNDKVSCCCQWENSIPKGVDLFE